MSIILILLGSAVKIILAIILACLYLYGFAYGIYIYDEIKRRIKNK